MNALMGKSKNGNALEFDGDEGKEDEFKRLI